MSKHDRQIEILARGACVQEGHMLICRNRKKGNLYLPGGHVEWGESAREALRREIREEMGRSCRVGSFLGVVEHSFIWKGRRTCEINLVFEMSVKGISPAQPPLSAEEKLEFLWMSLRQAARSSLQPASLRQALSGWMRPVRKGKSYLALDEA